MEDLCWRKQRAGASTVSRSLLAAVWLGVTFAAQAHDPGLSAVSIQLGTTNLTASLTVARGDVEALASVDADHDGRISQPELDAKRALLEVVALDAFEMSVDGHALTPAKAWLELDSNDAIRFQLLFPRPGTGKLNIRSSVISRLPRGHRQYISVRDEAQKVLAEQILDSAHDSLPVQLAEAPAAQPHSFGQFLLLGIEHIATGYDHIVFLLGLLIVGGSFRAVVKIITSFTLAHSVTLALAALDVIRLSSNIVEPLIAVSIMYVGIENIFRRDLERRWMLAFGFGLVHGCGFASALRDLRIGEGGGSVVMPILSFNLGVELGQITLATIVLPIVWKLKKRSSFEPRYVPAFSLLIAGAGGYWLVERMITWMR